MPDKELYFENPILPGFYPDPSVCRVGEDYYLVNSSFTFFPGIPLFHSRDLVNWEQLGHVLDRPGQLPLNGLSHSQGIYAPTLRWHRGTFYLVSTLIGGGGNFIVTASNPAGPWSDPVFIQEAPGIDPSLFFEDDGRCFMMGTADAPEGGRYFGDNEIWLRELDLTRFTLKGERHGLWRGALKDAIWAEGPHLYKKGDYYYLLIAEGGTDYHHAVTVARSKKLTGPYEGCPSNPVLTHRHLGRKHPIVNVGHGDLVETPKGEWWITLLGSRPFGGYYRNLGRETFLAPVVWEEDWPVLCPCSGKVEKRYPIPDLTQENRLSARKAITLHKDQGPDYVMEGFGKEEPDLIWNCMGTPEEPFWQMSSSTGALVLALKPQGLNSSHNPSFLGRRLQHIHYSVECRMGFLPEKEGQWAGVAAVQSPAYHIRLEYGLEKGRTLVRLVVCEKGIETLIAQKPLAAPSLCLRVEARGQDYSFYYGSSGKQEEGDKREMAQELLATGVDGRVLSTERAGGFTGAYIGVWGTSGENAPHKTAEFTSFTYRGWDRKG